MDQNISTSDRARDAVALMTEIFAEIVAEDGRGLLESEDLCLRAGHDVMRGGPGPRARAARRQAVRVAAGGSARPRRPRAHARHQDGRRVVPLPPLPRRGRPHRRAARRRPRPAVGGQGVPRGQGLPGRRRRGGVVRLLRRAARLGGRLGRLRAHRHARRAPLRLTASPDVACRA